MRSGRLTDPHTWFGLARWSLLLAAAAVAAGCALPAGARSTSAAGVTASAAPAVENIVAGPPAPAPANGAKPAAPDMNKLKKQLQDYLSDQSGTYGVYVVDLTTGKGTGINADKVFPAASTFKLPMTLYILDQAARGKASLDETLTYTDEDYEDGTGTLQDTVADGDTFTVRQLIELAITQSDNIATRMLLRRFSQDNVYDYMHRLGGKVTTFDDEAWGTTPREMATYMKDVQSNGVLKDPDLRAFLLHALENTAFDDRTAAGVPDGVPVAHKIGTLPNVVNDVALVLAPDHPFIVSAYSMDVDDDAAPQVITEVTKKVYDFLTAS